MQEAYLQAYRSLDKFRGEAKLSTWPIDAAIEAHEEEGDTMLRRLLEKRIDALPDDYRAVFVLRALEELSVEETAAAPGIPEATVRTRYFRARGLLRESLARDVDRTREEAFSFAGERCDRVVAKVLERIAAGT